MDKDILHLRNKLVFILYMGNLYVEVKREGAIASSLLAYMIYFFFFTTNLSNTANKLGSTSKINVIADAAPIEITRQICAMVGSALIKPITPVTMVIISPEVRTV